METALSAVARPLAFLAASTLLAASVCAAPVRNDRPPRPRGAASSIVAACNVTVRFNEDEASVKESEYMDSSFCLGVMQGLLGLNDYLDTPAFCLPPEGIKNWIAAKVVVDYGKSHPYKLVMEQMAFAVEALKTAYPCGN